MNSKITLFTIFLVALLVLLAPTTEARRSAPTVTPAKNYEQDVAGLGMFVILFAAFGWMAVCCLLGFGMSFVQYHICSIII
mmetsp:Transcript_1332/g.2643  ORF Transcript_1332/g.2643 Transcript_1332/m.2643 type:complete len:81 (+) Transcript_1332:245-487(+)